MNDSPPLPRLVFNVTNGGWHPLVNGRYDTSIIMKKAGAIAHLVASGWTHGRAKMDMDTFEDQTIVYGADMFPGGDIIYTDPDANVLRLNLWTKPTLVPKPGPFPTIDMVFDYNTGGDPEAKRWVLHTFAQRIRDQNQMMKIAIVWCGYPGSGKDFIFKVMAEILGPKNCGMLTASEVESRFFGKFCRNLLNYMNEATTSENKMSLGPKLKVLIDSSEIESEKKYENSITVRNRMLWMFASNDPISPVEVDGNDRRYSVFSNFTPVTAEHTARLKACFEADKVTKTPAFLDEIAGFAHYLSTLEIDRDFISRPYGNAARDGLIDTNRPSYEMFFRDLEEQGFDALYEAALERDYTLREDDRKNWDFGDAGVATAIIYRVYRAYCKDTGQYPLRMNKLGGALKNHVPKWEHVRIRVPESTRQVWCYAVPRKGDK